jgi:hypothetical protein
MNYVTRIMANARVHLTGAVDDAIKLELFNAVDEFCKETNVWREEIPVTIIEGTGIVYDLVPTLGKCLRLIDLYISDNKIRVVGEMLVPGELTITSPLGVGVVLTSVVSLQPFDPTDDTNNFPVVADWIWERYSVEITHGLIYKMTTQPNKPYSNTATAAYHGRKFRNAISVARADQTSGNIAGGQRWRFPMGINGSQRR